MKPSELLSPPFPAVAEHPDYAWREVKPCTFDELDGEIQFVAIRKFHKNDEGRLDNFRKELSLAMDHFGLGRVVWLHFAALSARNWREFLAHCARKKCFLFNIWGYVPGQGGDEVLSKDFGEFQPGEADHKLLLKTMGNRFLGYDIGEQDSRYLMIFSPLQCPFSMNRQVQYRNFHRFFRRMRRDLREDVSVLAGSSLIHFLAKEGGTRMIGVESLQIHMNINVWYAFVRGAGKQYGILWFGNASMFNAFGYRDFCPDRIDAYGLEVGVSAGPSDNMLRRVLYALFVYNSTILGFEHFLYNASSPKPELTGCGQIQKEVMRLAADKTLRKQLHTPVAILTDFFQGWVPPRNVVNMDTHRVWGGIPYSMGDYQISALFHLFYPGYADSAAFRDERGFLTETPFGDVCDVILSDCRPEVLDGYDLIILAGDMSIHREIAFKLRRFVKQGGRLILSTSVQGWESIAPGKIRQFSWGCRIVFGTGDITVIAIPNMLESKPRIKDYVNRVDIPCPLVYELDATARDVLVRVIRQVIPLRVKGECMATFSFNDHESEALLLLGNSGGKPQRVQIGCPQPISALQTLEGGGTTATVRRGKLNATLPPGGSVLLKASFARPLCRRSRIVWQKPLPFQLAIKWNGAGQSLEDTLLRLPSFRNFFDGIVLTSEYFENISEKSIARDAAFLRTRGIAVHACDVTPAINHYPDASLIGGGQNTPQQALDFLKNILCLAHHFGKPSLILPSSKNGELAINDREAVQRIKNFYMQAAMLAAHHKTLLHLKPGPHRFFDSYAAMQKLLSLPELADCGLWFDLSHFVIMRHYNSSIKHGYPKFFEKSDSPGVREIKDCFYSGYPFVRQKRDGTHLAAALKRAGKHMRFVALSSPLQDCLGKWVDAHRPVKGSPLEKEVVSLLRRRVFNGKTLVLDLDADMVADFDTYFSEWEFLFAANQK